ncbi:MAG: hypothetical protein MZV49_24060 [Rhodopseudomonas palustris]|nr:hypothetical protein [Rhodopseudomonas palustris]
MRLMCVVCAKFFDAPEREEECFVCRKERIKRKRTSSASPTRSEKRLAAIEAAKPKEAPCSKGKTTQTSARCSGGSSTSTSSPASRSSSRKKSRPSSSRSRKELGYESVFQFHYPEQPDQAAVQRPRKEIQALVEHLKVEFSAEEPKPRKVVVVKK